jgi:hypothetical protein
MGQDFIDFLEEHHKKLSKEDKDILLGAKGAAWQIESYHYIWAHKKDSYDNLMAIYMHELFHHVMNKLKDCMLEYGEETEEAYAYYFEYLFEKIEPHIKKWK